MCNPIKIEDLILVCQKATTPWVKDTRELVLSQLEAVTALRPETVRDTDPVLDADRPEIILGGTVRQEEKRVLETLAFNEYGVFIRGRKIVLAGWTPYTVRLAAQQFASNLSQYLVADADGVYFLDLQKVSEIKGVYEAYYGDLPVFEGEIQGVYDANDDCYSVWYKNVDADGFAVYTKTVESEGYRAVNRNSIGANSYATYVKDGRKLHVYHIAKGRKLRIVYGPDDLIPELMQPVTHKAAGYVVPSATIMPMQYVPAPGGGACMIFTLEDGTFFVIDGGWKEEAEVLYKTLRALNTDANGADAPIVISAWFISHGHGDHTGCIYTFAPTYGDRVTVNALIYNGVHDTQVCTSRVSRDIALYRERVNEGILAYFKDGNGNTPRVMKLHSGQKLCFGGAEIDVMYTHEDMFDVRVSNFNDFNTVLRLKLGGETMMLASDANSFELPSMIYEVGKEPLKANFVMVVHHAGDHSDMAYYQVVGAKYYFFPNSYEHYVWHTIDQAKFQPWAEYVRVNATEIYLADDWDPEYKTHNTCTTVYLPYTEGTYVEWNYATERPSVRKAEGATHQPRPTVNEWL